MNRVFSETDRQADQARYEIKGVYHGLDADIVRSLIKGHSSLFKPTYPPREVSNIYFDSLDQQLRMAHILGFQKRIKIRLRWYHGSWQFSDSQLEIKQKSGNLGTKSIFSIPEQMNLQNMDWHQLYLTINSHLPPGIQQLFRQTTPILINNYQREYYQSADQLIRLTLDTCIKSLDQTFGNRANLINYLPMRNYCVVELKAGTSHHLKIAEVLSEFPQYTSAFSKFLLGTETILPSSLG